MIKQLIFLFIMLLILAVIWHKSKEPLKAFLTVAIITTHWQGGYWVETMEQDIFFATSLFLFLFVMSFFEQNQRPLTKRFCIPVILVVMFMILGAIISSTTAINKAPAYGGIYSFFERYLMFYCIYNGVRKPSDIKYVLFAFIISIGFQGLLAILQPRFLWFRIGVIDEKDVGMAWRGRGTFFHPNALGIYLATTILLVLRMSITAFRHNKKKMRNLALIMSALAGAGLIASHNRGSWIALAVAVVCFFILELFTNIGKIRKYLFKMILPFSIIGFIAAIWLGNVIMIRLFRTDADVQLEQRRRQQREARELMKINPWFGIGYHNYKEYIAWEFVHNLYYKITVELGYWGVSFFFLLMLTWLFYLVKGSFSSVILVRNLSLALLSSMAAFLAASTVNPDYHMLGSKIGNHIWMFIAFTVALNDLSKRYSSKKIYFLYNSGKIDSETKDIYLKQLQEHWLKAFISDKKKNS